jgi:hypothetical protein
LKELGENLGKFAFKIISACKWTMTISINTVHIKRVLENALVR